MPDKPEEFPKVVAINQNEIIEPRTTSSETVNIVYEEIKERFKTQIEFEESFDTKISVILGTIGIVLTIVIGLHESFSSNYAYYSSTAILFVSLLFGIGAYYPRRFFVGPESRMLKVNYFLQQAEFVKEKLIDHYIDTFEKNKQVIKNKNLFFATSLITFIVALVILFVGITPTYNQFILSLQQILSTN